MKRASIALIAILFAASVAEASFLGDLFGGGEPEELAPLRAELIDAVDAGSYREAEAVLAKMEAAAPDVPSVAAARSIVAMGSRGELVRCADAEQSIDAAMRMAAGADDEGRPDLSEGELASLISDMDAADAAGADELRGLLADIHLTRGGMKGTERICEAAIRSLVSRGALRRSLRAELGDDDHRTLIANAISRIARAASSDLTQGPGFSGEMPVWYDAAMREEVLGRRGDRAFADWLRGVEADSEFERQRGAMTALVVQAPPTDRIVSNKIADIALAVIDTDAVILIGRSHVWLFTDQLGTARGTGLGSLFDGIMRDSAIGAERVDIEMINIGGGGKSFISAERSFDEPAVVSLMSELRSSEREDPSRAARDALVRYAAARYRKIFCEGER